MSTPALLMALLAGYLLGAIPFALVVGKALGVDVQQAGSGNAGARNTFVTAGLTAAILVALLDAAKAVLAALIGWLAAGAQGSALGGSAAVAGHCFSPLLMLRWWGQLGHDWRLTLRRLGGKGLASGLAVLLLVAWPAALIVLGICLLARLAVFRDETWPTVIAVLCAPPLVWWWTRSTLVASAVLVAALLIVVKHLPDLRGAYYVNKEQGTVDRP